jgi:hypothetical protein
MTALRGDFHRWSRFLSSAFPAGAMENVVIAVHVFSAALLMASGTAQLVPRVRDRFPVFHRYNGRTFMLAAVLVSLAGFYLIWVRGTPGDVSQHVGATLNGVLILVFAAEALRHAMARDFPTHRRWALRLFIAVSANLFLRLTLFASSAVFGGPMGFDPTTFSGPFLTLLTFGQYLVPLAVLELYLRAQDHAGAIQKTATAALLFVLTVAMGGGIGVLGAAVWVPELKAAFDPRTPIGETLAATMASSGIDQATKQYHDLKTTQPNAYNFEERELNGLGYRLLRNKQVKEAIRIFQLNVDAYPESSNVYDSLGEGYMNDGNKPLAIVNYQKSLDLNPKNRGAVLMLQKLGAL